MCADPKDCVLRVLARRTGLDPGQINSASRLLHDLHIDGDDAVDVILEVSKRCSMDVSEFDSSQYFRPEPSLLSLLWFLPFQRRNQMSKKRPLTVGELIDAASQGKLRS